MLRQDEYNRKVQDMQEFCLAAGVNYRISTTTHWKTGLVNGAIFEGYYDGMWYTFGTELDPMTPQRRYQYDDSTDQYFRARVAQDIVK